MIFAGRGVSLTIVGGGLDQLQSRERSRFYPKQTNLGEIEPSTHSLPTTPLTAAGIYPTTIAAYSQSQSNGARPILTRTGSGQRITTNSIISNGSSRTLSQSPSSGTIIHTSSPSSGPSHNTAYTCSSPAPAQNMSSTTPLPIYSFSPSYPSSTSSGSSHGSRSNANSNSAASLAALQALLASTTYAQRVSSSSSNIPNAVTYLSSNHSGQRASTNGGIMGPSQSLAHILTPSGQALAIGGKIRNVAVAIHPSSTSPSSTPLAHPHPCIMWWPDNEPLPHLTQIRPLPIGMPPTITGTTVAAGNLPPIMNTGNKGPIESQPGDWHCGVCGYLVRSYHLLSELN